MKTQKEGKKCHRDVATFSSLLLRATPRPVTHSLDGTRPAWHQTSSRPDTHWKRWRRINSLRVAIMADNRIRTGQLSNNKPLTNC